MPTPPEAYGAFALAYDDSLGRLFAEELTPVLEEILESYGLRGGSHLDLACGTSLIAPVLERLGFATVGLDASIEMLAVSRARSRRLACGDIRSIPLCGRFHLVTAFYDSLNHILDLEDLGTVFREVTRLLEPGGLFLFDVNHPEAFRNIWGAREPYRSSSDRHAISMWTRYSTRKKEGRARIEGWVEAGGRRVAVRENRRQRAHDEEEIRECLDRAGLEVREKIDFDPFPVSRKSDRKVKLLFVTERRQL